MRPIRYALFLLGFLASSPALPTPSQSNSHNHTANSQQQGKPAPSGLSIQILAPANSTQWQPGLSYMIEVKTEGFNTAGDHWHLYLDGQLKAMVGGGRTSHRISLPANIEPGEHEIKVTISNAAHEEYDLFDRRTVVVTQRAGN